MERLYFVVPTIKYKLLHCCPSVAPVAPVPLLLGVVHGRSSARVIFYFFSMFTRNGSDMIQVIQALRFVMRYLYPYIVYDCVT